MRSIGKITPDILNIFHQEAAVEQKRWILTFLKIHAAAVRRTYEWPALLPARTSQCRTRASLFDGLPGHPFLVQLLPDARRTVPLAAAAGEKARGKAVIVRNDAHSTVPPRGRSLPPWHQSLPARFAHDGRCQLPPQLLLTVVTHGGMRTARSSKRA